MGKNFRRKFGAEQPNGVAPAQFRLVRLRVAEPQAAPGKLANSPGCVAGHLDPPARPGLT